MRLLAFVALLLAPAAVRSEEPPPPRLRSEAQAVLSRSPGPPREERLRELRIVLLANEKDHGPEEHEYPLWQKRWAELFGGAEKTAVATAWDWPSREELEKADVLVAYTGTGGRWNPERIEDLRRFLERGGGFVAIHSAIIASRELARPLAELIGLAWEDGTTLFRHGPVELRVAAAEHPIVLGLPERIGFVDETYWPLVGDRSKIELLATADERDPAAGGRLAPQPIFWTAERGKGRVFGCVLGHYTWTFDDPYFRLLLLRGIGWAARGSPYRFDGLALREARVADALPQKPARGGLPEVPPLAPDPKDPALILWLDARDASTLQVDGEGRVSRWASKAGEIALESSGAERPLYIQEGGKPAVRFDGEDDVLRAVGLDRSVEDWTLLLAAAIRSNGGGFRALFATNRREKNDYISGINLDLGGMPSELFDALNLEGSQHQGQCNLKEVPAPFGPHWVAVRRAGETARAFIDGAPEGRRISARASASVDEIRIGARAFENPPGKLPILERGFLDGDIFEVIFYGKALTDEEIAGLLAYFRSRHPAPPAGSAEPSLDEAFSLLPRYDAGGSRRALAVIEDALVASSGDPERRRALEARLVEVLAGESTADAKDWIARELGIFGSRECVAALAPLLLDERLSHPARVALERIGGPEAARALREALPRARGKILAGIADSLGRLGDERFREALSPGAPPNVLLIVSDDHGWPDYGFLGSPNVRTPALDRLASQSLLFPRGYVPSSLCCPSLASLLTGLYPHQHKITSNDPPAPPGMARADFYRSKEFVEGRERMAQHLEAVPTLPKLLAARGYLSLQTGKWWQGHYRRGGFTHGMTEGERHGDRGLDIGRKTLEPIREFLDLARREARPWFIWYAPMMPHEPHDPPERILARYRDAAPSIHLARYWAMVEWFDETCGELLRLIDERGFAENTLIVYLADNGWTQDPARPGSLRSKGTPYDAGLRTPIFIHWPARVRPKVVERPVLSIDIAPTILAAAGLSPPREMPGVNLLDEDAVARRGAIFGACFTHDAVDLERPGRSALWRWAVEGRYKLIAPVSGAPELYDLLADPGETKDLAAENPNLVEELRKKLDAWWTPETP